MANTFLAAKGYNMEDSLVEAGSIDTAKAFMAKAAASCCSRSTRWSADKFDAEANSQVVDVDKVPAGWRMHGHRPEVARAVRRGAERRQAGRVERPDGRVRDARSSPKAPLPSPGCWPRAARSPSSAAATAPAP